MTRSRRILHLLTLGSFAVAQPLYDLIGKNAEFLVAHDAGPLTIAALVGLLSFAVPLLVVAVVELAGLLGPRVRTAAHSVAIAVLAGLIVAALVRQFPPAAAGAVAIGSGIAFAFAYQKLLTVRRLATVASPAILIFPIVFVTATPVARMAWPHRANQQRSAIAHRPPIVVVILDELSTFTLLDGRGEIDAQRFPGFAALARKASWFPNAVAAFPQTEKSIPAMLTGTPADGSDGLLPIEADHPHNLFTWLGRSYRMHVAEPVTSLCPKELCQPVQRSARTMVTGIGADLAVLYLHLVLPREVADERLPSVANAWKSFAAAGTPKTPNAPRQPFDVVAAFERASLPGRDELVRRFIREMGRDDRPTLHFLHVLLPHDPYVYLPSGRRYALGGLTGGLAPNGVWTMERPLIETGRQRHIAQARFTDKLIGELLTRLESEGLMDEALVIVTSDHGAAFEPGESHRAMTATNYPEIITTPMFVKLPRQKTGGVNDRRVSGIDIIPTIAWALGTTTPWATPGRSMFDERYPDRPTIEYAGLGVPAVATFDVRDAARARNVPGNGAPAFRQTGVARANNPGHDGNGNGPGGYAPAVDSLPKANALRVFSDNFGLFRSVRGEPDLVPALVQGRIECRSACEEHIPLAIAVNGKVQVTTTTVKWAGLTHYFAALVPESSLHSGANQLDVFAITPGGKLTAISTEFARGLTLTDAEGKELIVSSEGRHISISPDVAGVIDRASNDPDALRLWGWAADRAAERPLRAIVAFAGETAVAFTEPEAERPDVTAALGLKKGRKVSYMLRVAKQDLLLGRLRVFGISEGDHAAELPRGSDTEAVIEAAKRGR